MRSSTVALIFCFVAASSGAGSARSEPQPPPSSADGALYVGWAQADITPQKPVALIGQLHKRISSGVRDPLTATALALETKTAGRSIEQAIMVSCDVLYIRKAVQKRLRELLKSRIPDFEPDKLFLNATHTHTAPGFIDGTFRGLYDVSKDQGVMKASEYADYFVQRVAEAVVEAWNRRKPGAVGWALGHAVVGTNRRARYFDGSAVMYGATNIESFSGIEGYEDHAVEMLLFCNPDRKPTGLVVNIACTAQETESLSEISADFWHEVRLELRDRISKDIFVLPQCAAAGDISPHLLFRKRAEDAMLKARGLSRRREIARRIADAVEDVLPLAARNAAGTLRFEHAVAAVDLPACTPERLPFYDTDPVTGAEFHVLRLGDIAVATNPFELYIEYGLRIKSRSPAMLTFLVQTACRNCGYLPTQQAVNGGGYSADKFIVGPEGGQILVNHTLTLINQMWN
jgi:hypothetical protein